MTATTPTPLLLIDGSGLLYRAYYGMPSPSLNRLPHQVRVMLLAAVKRWRPGYLMVALDSPESFRQRAIPGYKADRLERDGPSTDELTAAVRPDMESWGVAIREADGMEADDVIAALVEAAKPFRCHVSVLTRDTDLLQLVSDADRVRVLWPGGRKADGEAVLDDAAVAAYLAQHRQFGVAFPHAQLLDLRVIAGGKDNLPRIGSHTEPKGFTTRRAAKLLADGASLDTLRTTDAWRLVSREARWLEAGWDAAVARRDALRLRTEIKPRAAGGASSVARLLRQLRSRERA